MPNNRRVNVALSRARSFFVSVCNGSIVSGSLAFKTKTNGPESHCKYEVLAHWLDLYCGERIIDYAEPLPI